MLLRCSFESKPSWNGRSRPLFQNNNNHKPARTSSRICPRHRAMDCLKLTFHRNVTTEAIAMRMMEKIQIFFTASNVPSPLATELPAPGVFAHEASAAWRQEEPAKDVSQL